MRPFYLQDGGSGLVTPDAVEAFARWVVTEFAEVVSGLHPAAADFRVLKAAHRAGGLGEERADRLIWPTVGDRGVTIYVDAEELAGISAAALRGGLEFAMVFSAHNNPLEPAKFNFKQQILPLMTVSGSAAVLVRELVEYLSISLQNYQTTRELIELGRGVPQVCFRYFRITDQQDRCDGYAATVFHDWIRALNLCKKAREYVVLELLAASRVDAAQDLMALWREGHELLAEDVRLLAELSAVPAAKAGEAFSAQLVEMFSRVKAALLVRSETFEVSGAVH